MAGPYTDIVVGATGTGVSRAGFGLPVKAAIDDLHLRTAALESTGPTSWSSATSSDGTVTASGSSTQVRDAVLGNLEVTLGTGRRYKASWIGSAGISASTATLVVVKIYRKTGTGNPATTDTLVTRDASGKRRLTTTGGGGEETLEAWGTFTVPTTGVYTFAAFTSNGTATAVVITPKGDRELLIEEIGPTS